MQYVIHGDSRNVCVILLARHLYVHLWAQVRRFDHSRSGSGMFNLGPRWGPVINAVAMAWLVLAVLQHVPDT